MLNRNLIYSLTMHPCKAILDAVLPANYEQGSRYHASLRDALEKKAGLSFPCAQPHTTTGTAAAALSELCSQACTASAFAWPGVHPQELSKHLCLRFHTVFAFFWLLF